MTATQRITAARKSICKQGACAFCGGPYAAHRVIDSEMGRAANGESLESIVQEFGEADALTMVVRWIALMELLYEKTAKPDGARERGVTHRKKGAA